MTVLFTFSLVGATGLFKKTGW